METTTYIQLGRSSHTHFLCTDMQIILSLAQDPSQLPILPVLHVTFPSVFSATETKVNDNKIKQDVTNNIFGKKKQKMNL